MTVTAMTYWRHVPNIARAVHMSVIRGGLTLPLPLGV